MMNKEKLNQRFMMLEKKKLGKALFEEVVAPKTSLEKVRSLIDAGADVNVEDVEAQIGDSKFTSTLRAAVGLRKIEIVKLLLEAGANVNATAEDGWTALMLAARNGHVEIVNLLLEAGAKIGFPANSLRQILKG